MSWIRGAVRFWRDERGVIAVIVALGLPALVGLTGAAVDLGSIYTARAELQNAADSAALAGAATLIGYDEDNRALAQPEVALDTAREYTARHTRVGFVVDPANPEGPREAQDLPLVLRDQDFTVGLWNKETRQFDYTGFSTDPNDLNAVRVKLRRDSLANDPVETFFAKILGIDRVPVEAEALAVVDWARAIPPGDELEPPDEEPGYRCIPISVNHEAVGEGGGITEGYGLVFHSENRETGEWTSFFTFPTNDPVLRDYIRGDRVTPFIKVGDWINVINGNLSTVTWLAMENEFKTPISQGGRNSGTWDEPTPWLVLLPVVRGLDGGAVTVEVVGFLHFYITEVMCAPYQYVAGYVTTGRVIPQAGCGGAAIGNGGNFGTRANRPVLMAGAS